MDQPFTVFYCDVCGEPITDVARGYVVWAMDDSDFKIIHQARCDKRPHAMSNALTDFLGERGLNYLLSFLSVGPAHAEADTDRCRISTQHMHDFIDFFRRVQLPYYEEARRHFALPEVQDYVSTFGESAPYRPDALRRIIQLAGRPDTSG